MYILTFHHIFRNYVTACKTPVVFICSDSNTDNVVKSLFPADFQEELSVTNIVYVNCDFSVGCIYLFMYIFIYFNSATAWGRAAAPRKEKLEEEVCYRTKSPPPPHEVAGHPKPSTPYGIHTGGVSRQIQVFIPRIELQRSRHTPSSFIPGMRHSLCMPNTQRRNSINQSTSSAIDSFHVAEPPGSTFIIPFTQAPPSPHTTL